MSHRELYIFVEGQDDSRFFNKYEIRHRLEEIYAEVAIIEYSKTPKKSIVGLIRTLLQRGDHYLFVGDLDKLPCVTEKKSVLKGIFVETDDSPILDDERIVVVKRVIEGWYLAGLGEGNCARLGISSCRTETITKGQLKRMKPGKFSSTTDFLIEILNYFSLRRAIQENDSFRYFVEKHLPSTS